MFFSKSIASISNPTKVSALLRGFHFTTTRSSYPLGKTGKPLPPYIRFCKEKSPEVKSAHSDLKQTELMRKMGEKWRALSESERSRYKQEYEEAKNSTN